MERGGILVFVNITENEHRFELPPRGSVADLRTILTPVCASANLCFYLQSTGQLLCDADVLSDFAEQPSTPPSPPDSPRDYAEELSPEKLIRVFERSPEEFYPRAQLCVRVLTSEGMRIFVRAAGCIHTFHCGPQDSLRDLRDLCARTFSLDPVQVTLKDANGSLLPLSRDGHILQDLKNVSVLDAEAGEGFVRVFLVLSDSCISCVNVPAATSLADFRHVVTAHVGGLASIKFRLWNRGAEIAPGDKETVGQRLFGGHPVFVELEADLELLLLPRCTTGGFREPCEAPALDMSASIELWLEEEEREKKALQGLFPQSKLEHLLDRVIALTAKEPPLSVNVDGRCLARHKLSSTLKELQIESGAVVRTEPPLQLHVDFDDSDTVMLTIPCRCTTVLELRKKIEKESGMPLSQVRLVVKDMLLPDCLSISECGLRGGDHVLCRRALRLRLWWEDQLVSFFTSPEMNLTEISSFLEEKTGISGSMLALTDLSNGRVIFPNKKVQTVSEAGLSEISEISVSERPQGSAGTWVSNAVRFRSDLSAFPSFMSSTVSDDEDEDDDDNFDSGDD